MFDRRLTLSFMDSWLSRMTPRSLAELWNDTADDCLVWYTSVVVSMRTRNPEVLGSIPAALFMPRAYQAIRLSEVGKLILASLGGENSYVQPWGGECRAAVRAVPFIILLTVCLL